MYEFVNGRWLFNPDVVGDISPSRDVHLARMTQRTGQDHNVALKEYEIREP